MRPAAAADRPPRRAGRFRLPTSTGPPPHACAPWAPHLPPLRPWPASPCRTSTCPCSSACPSAATRPTSGCCTWRASPPRTASARRAGEGRAGAAHGLARALWLRGRPGIPALGPVHVWRLLWGGAAPSPRPVLLPPSAAVHDQQPGALPALLLHRVLLPVRAGREGARAEGRGAPCVAPSGAGPARCTAVRAPLCRQPPAAPSASAPAAKPAPAPPSLQLAAALGPLRTLLERHPRGRHPPGMAAWAEPMAAPGCALRPCSAGLQGPRAAPPLPCPAPRRRPPP